MGAGSGGFMELRRAIREQNRHARARRERREATVERMRDRREERSWDDDDVLEGQFAEMVDCVECGEAGHRGDMFLCDDGSICEVCHVDATAPVVGISSRWGDVVLIVTLLAISMSWLWPAWVAHWLGY